MRCRTRSGFIVFNHEQYNNVNFILILFEFEIILFWVLQSLETVYIFIKQMIKLLSISNKKANYKNVVRDQDKEYTCTSNEIETFDAFFV